MTNLLQNLIMLQLETQDRLPGLAELGGLSSGACSFHCPFPWVVSVAPEDTRAESDAEVQALVPERPMQERHLQ